MAMKISVKEMTDTSAVFVIEGVHHSFVNALRRTMLADVMKMAIDDVTIYDNTSALFDEIVAHRLGLVPIPTDLTAFVPREECTCNGEGCANCTILYTLSKEGPTMVVSGDLTPADPRFKIKDEKIPIVKLLEGQRLMLESAAILGNGTKHAKWAPAHAIGYREIAHAEFKTQPTPAQVSELQKTAPAGAFAFEDGKVRIVDESIAYDYLKSATAILKLEGVKLSTEKDKFLFHMETDGSISPKEALTKATQILMDKLKVVENDVPKLKFEEVAVSSS